MSRTIPAGPARVHRACRSSIDAACGIAVRLAAREAGIERAAVLVRPRGPRGVARARYLAIYLAHVGLGAPLAEVARRFGRHRASAARACRIVEERREIAAVDSRIAELEGAARHILQGVAAHDA